MSYHIMNAIWIGVLPMLAVTLIIIVICYFLCCINNIRNKLKKRKIIKSFIKQQQQDVDNERQEREREQQQQQQQFNYQQSPRTPPPPPSPPKFQSQQQQQQQQEQFVNQHSIEIDEPDKAYFDTFKNDNNNNNNNTRQNLSTKYTQSTTSLPPIETTYNTTNKSTSEFDISKLLRPYPLKSALATRPRHHNHNHYYSNNTNVRKIKSMHILYDNTFNNDGPLEQLEVRELSESPKSLYSRLKNRLTDEPKQPRKQSLVQQQQQQQQNHKSQPPPPFYQQHQIIKQPQQQQQQQPQSKSQKPFTSTKTYKLPKHRIARQSSSSITSSEQDESSLLFNVTRKPKKLTLKYNSSTNATYAQISGAATKATFSSDIDNEDNIIFDDEDDTLSSTGVCAYNNGADRLSLLSTLSLKTLKTSSRNLLNNSNLASSRMSNINNLASSISSIDPDENILNDILVKSNPKINEVK